jgi:hypothetical protein
MSDQYFVSMYCVCSVSIVNICIRIFAACNTSKYQKQTTKCFSGVKRGRCIGLTTLLPSVSRLSRLCGILSILQPYRPPQPIMRRKTPWPYPASELYRSNDRLFSAKLVSTFMDRGCHVVSVTHRYGRIFGFLDRSRYFFFQVAPQLYSRA